MMITEVEGHNVKLSAHTITVKDDEGKTRGLVRSASRYQDLPMNRQIDFWKTVKRSGLLSSGGKFMRAVFVDGKNLYWLCNNSDEELIQTAQAAGVTVIKVKRIL